MKKSPADILADTARVLYDDHSDPPHWRMAVARGLDVDSDTVRRWMSGRTVLKPNHPALRDLLDLVRDRTLALCQAGDNLQLWLAEQDKSGQSPRQAGEELERRIDKNK